MVLIDAQCNRDGEVVGVVRHEDALSARASRSVRDREHVVLQFGVRIAPRADADGGRAACFIRVRGGPARTMKRKTDDRGRPHFVVQQEVIGGGEDGDRRRDGGDRAHRPFRRIGRDRDRERRNREGEQLAGEEAECERQRMDHGALAAVQPSAANRPPQISLEQQRDEYRDERDAGVGKELRIGERHQFGHDVERNVVPGVRRRDGPVMRDERAGEMIGRPGGCARRHEPVEEPALGPAESAGLQLRQRRAQMAISESRQLVAPRRRGSFFHGWKRALSRSLADVTARRGRVVSLKRPIEVIGADRKN